MSASSCKTVTRRFYFPLVRTVTNSLDVSVYRDICAGCHFKDEDGILKQPSFLTSFLCSYFLQLDSTVRTWITTASVQHDTLQKMVDVLDCVNKYEVSESFLLAILSY